MRLIMKTTVLAVAAIVAGSGTAVATGNPADARRVETVTYHLGDQAFTPPADLGNEGKNELDGVVYYPSDVSAGTHPLIMIEHGSWQTCADRAATDANTAAQAALAAAEKAGDDAEAARQQKIVEQTSARMWTWPCAPGVPPMPSNAGYEYLGRQLAQLGFVVVSIGTNGINATAAGQAPTVYYTRAALLNAQLTLWQQLASNGQGPLHGHFTDPATGKPRNVGFQGHLNMGDVGTLGHSMGGGGVLQQAADQRHGDWPAGVTVKAVFALAPTDNWNDEPVTQVPFAQMWGTCDQVNTGNYFAGNSGANQVPIYRYTLTGGNHDSYNTEWSPSGHQVGSHDDALPGTRPGTCASQFPDGPQQDQPQLTETRQRASPRPTSPRSSSASSTAATTSTPYSPASAARPACRT
ncbi:hypothetical protein ABZU76_17560 [Amycolatopsis sp. NPDC005232]|uniref:hypothetical protein n=1 Tax=Amycolatopsis sp. NPDC005232 TaxID=3157027 RepID=UPI0033B888E2